MTGEDDFTRRTCSIDKFCLPLCVGSSFEAICLFGKFKLKIVSLIKLKTQTVFTKP